MCITEITVRAGRTFNHPHEQFSNLRPEVVLTAALAPGEEAAAAARQLQAQAEQLVEDHKQALLRSLEELWRLTQHQAEMRGLQRTLTQAQERLEEIRKENPQLKELPE